MKKLSIAALCAVASVSYGQQLICRLSPTAVAAKVAARHNLKLLDTTYNAPFALFGLPSGANGDTVQASLTSDTDIVWAEDDDDMSMPETTGKGSTIGAIGDWKALYSQNANVLNQIKWTSFWAMKPGRTVKVAVLDTGLSSHMRTIWANVVASVNLVEPSEMAFDRPRHEDSNHNGIYDENSGHGTMVAGIVSVVAPQTKLIVVRIADSDGNSTAWRMIKGLTFAVANGAEVANISLGSPHEIPALSDVLDWTQQKGLLICSPVGNDNLNTSLYPAKLGKILAVAGVDAKDVKASFSNWDGLTIASAPATGIKSWWFDGSIGVWSGTSFASPFVAAAVADALRQVSVPVAPDILKRIVFSSGDNIDAANPLFKSQLGTRLDIVKLENAIINAAKSGSGGGSGSGEGSP